MTSPSARSIDSPGTSRRELTKVPLAEGVASRSRIENAAWRSCRSAGRVDPDGVAVGHEDVRELEQPGFGVKLVAARERRLLLVELEQRAAVPRIDGAGDDQPAEGHPLARPGWGGDLIGRQEQGLWRDQVRPASPAGGPPTRKHELAAVGAGNFTRGGGGPRFDLRARGLRVGGAAAALRARRPRAGGPARSTCPRATRGGGDRRRAAAQHFFQLFEHGPTRLIISSASRAVKPRSPATAALPCQVITMTAHARNIAAAFVGAVVLARSAAVAEQPPESAGTAIVVAGQAFEVGRPVVLWRDPQGFNAYQTTCIDQHGGCCDGESKRYGVRKGVERGSLDELQTGVSQLVLHFDGCVNSRSCFKSMHNRPRPSGNGCGLSAHFMIDADGTIYQTLDLVERGSASTRRRPTPTPSGSRSATVDASTAANGRSSPPTTGRGPRAR